MAALSHGGDRFKRAEMLIDIGTEALRLRFDEWLPQNTLQENLRQMETVIKRKASRPNFATLYPKNGTVSSMDMDLTLMVFVLRITETLMKPQFSTFDSKPHEHEISDGADVVRLKFYRNELTHAKVKELNEQEFKEISQTLIKVIERFSGSQFDDLIRCIMTRSLDYRAGSITWHAQEAIALVNNALKEWVLKPAKVSVIQLNEQQPLHYSIIGWTVVYGMQNISEIPSREELIYYLLHVHSHKVRQCILILNECFFPKQKFAELNLCHRKQDNSPNIITPVDLRTEGNVAVSGSNSDFPEPLLQSGDDKHTSMLLPKSYAIDLAYTNDKPFQEKYYNPLPYTEMMYKIMFEQKSNTSHSLKGSGSTDSTTKIERYNSFKESVENNFDATCCIVQTIEFPSSSQSSTRYPGSNLLQAHVHVSMKHAEMGCVPSDNSFTNLSESVLKERLGGFTWKKDYEPANKKVRDEPNSFCDLRWYFMLTIFLFVLYIIVREVYPYFYTIFKSRIQAASLTALVVLLYLIFILQMYINYM